MTRTDRSIRLAQHVARILLGVVVLMLWLEYGPSFVASITESPQHMTFVLVVLVFLGLLLRIVRSAWRLFVPNQSTQAVAYAIPVGMPMAVRSSSILIRRDLPDRLQAARHEAAHAVTVVAVGAQVESLEVHNDNGTTSGTTRRLVADNEEWDATLFWGMLQVTMAGHLWDVGHGVFDSGSHQDWSDALHYATCLTSCGQPVPGLPDGQLDPMQAIVAARTAVAEILAKNTDRIERVAVALSDRGSLTGAEFLALIGGRAPTSCGA